MSVEKSTEKSIIKFELTKDGSPTARFWSPDGTESTESMHSFQGAFSETDYIYGHALRFTLERGWDTSVLSVGLGLGYGEILSAALCPEARGLSFEIDERLREGFLAWVEGRDHEWSVTYESIVQRCADLKPVTSAAIREHLRRWQFAGELGAQTQFSEKYSCILFDAFSSGASPTLWTEEFLVEFLARAAADHCVFSTYACTGALKRALKRSGFTLEIREGFASKRDSTFAYRM